jgi:NAD(P)-dependent dehydrogenase (short-subunit alcohol dehydrogenase family)
MKNKKLALVTGATGAIGKAIARQLVALGNHKVIMVVKNENKALKAIEEIRKLTRSVDVSYVICDLSVKQQIHALAMQMEGPVDVLVNNAAMTPQNRMETGEGIEMQFATNVLGYFWMIKAFTPQLKAAGQSRVVNVASYWAGGLDLNDLEFKRRHYDNDQAYRQSKQADRMLTVSFAEKLAPFGISINACHPGDVNSALSNSLGFGGQESPDMGADCPVWLACSDEVTGITGKYFEHRRQMVCSLSANSDRNTKLFDICSRY